MLEQFISKDRINAECLVGVLQSQPICVNLFHLERAASDDEIIVSEQVITSLFCRFAGRSPNYIETESNDPAIEYNQRSVGIPLSDVVWKVPQSTGKGPLQTYKYCFLAVDAVEWLCDFTSIIGRDEAGEMAAHFARFGLIQLLSDRRKMSDSIVIFTVRGTTATGPDSAVETQGEFRDTAKAVYHVTEKGRKVAQWTDD